MNYINIHKIEPRLKRAVEMIRTAKERAIPALVADNPHELMRCLEVQDIIELSELHAQASLMRTESRMLPCHYRVDYPTQDDAHWANIIITAQNVAGETRYARERID